MARQPAPAPSSGAATATMRANRGKDTGPELELRKMLRDAGYSGYRLHWRKAPGRPDIAYPGRRIAILVNGCFWHRCPNCDPPMPEANRAFWAAKFDDNTARDERKLAELEANGWRVITVWECELRGHPDRVMDELTRALGG
ncbi:MAG: very short patch repair endonuclease [Coriobacteriia bacterium]